MDSSDHWLWFFHKVRANCFRHCRRFQRIWPLHPCTCTKVLREKRLLSYSSNRYNDDIDNHCVCYYSPLLRALICSKLIGMPVNYPSVHGLLLCVTLSSKVCLPARVLAENLTNLVTSYKDYWRYHKFVYGKVFCDSKMGKFNRSMQKDHVRSYQIQFRPAPLFRDR